jgi:GrpB-like predicted nucleotidyltransferase (UPF0157 family)
MNSRIIAGQGNEAWRRLSDRFEEYLRYTSKTIPEAIQHHAKEVVEAIFILTPRASAAVIRAKLESLGWKFKRAPKSYAKRFAGRSTDADSKAADAERKRILDKLNVRRKPNQKRADAMRAALAANPEIAQAFKKAERLTLGEQRDAAYNFRVSKIGSMAASWIPAMRKLKSRMNVAGPEKRVKQRPMSSVEILDGGAYVRIVNKMSGIVGLAERIGFIDAAFEMRNADMQEYIQRKMREGISILNPSGRR